jgi:hypothetical protein
MTRTALCCLCLTALCALSARAAQPLITDDTGTQGQGGRQLELSHTDERARQASVVGRSRASGATYTLGLTDQTDVFVAGAYRSLKSPEIGSTSGGGNLVLGLKWRAWAQPSGGLSLALKPELILPVSASREAAGLGTGRTSYGLTAIASQETFFGAVHFNVGLGRERFRQTQDDEDLRRYSVAPVWEIDAAWKLALDVGQQFSKGADGLRLRTRFVEIGAIFSPHKNQDWALGLIRSQENDNPQTTSRTLTGGWTWRF